MKDIVLLSGGLDSATLLASVLFERFSHEVLAVNMYYGQRHDKEIEAARAIAETYSVKLMELDLSQIFKESDCSLLKHSGKSIPAGTYAEQMQGTNIVSTYVPFRNGLMLSAAASIAVSVGANTIYYGAHADDAAGNAYPDCSEDFVEVMNAAIYEGTGRQAVLRAPFINKHKADIVKTGLMLNVPYELTWSCYEGGDKPCGKCATCIDRIKAFEANGAKDPLQYIER